MAYYQDVGAGGETSNSYPPADCYSLTRVGVYHRMSVDHFRKLIADAEEKNSWLILFFHMISDESRPLAYPPAQFRELMEYIHTQPVEVVTQWEGVQLARAAGQPPPPASNKPRQAQATPAGSARKSAAPTVPVKKPRPPAKPISPPQTSGEKPRP
jgi:hypothetical protein